MGAAWAEAASLVVAFDSSSKDRTDYTDWKADFIHLLSLQHALAVMSLRLDADLRNIVPHLPYQDFDGPSSVSGMRAEEGDEEAEEESQSTVGRGERQQSDYGDYATPMGSARRLSPRESPRVGFGPHTVRGDYGSDRSLVDVGREGGSPQTPRAR